MRVHTILAAVMLFITASGAADAYAGWLFWGKKPKTCSECIEHYMSPERSTSAKYYLRNACRHKFNPSIIWPEAVCDCVLESMNTSRSNIASHYINKACHDLYGKYQKKGWPDALCECVIENMKAAETDGDAAAILQRCRQQAMQR